MEFNFWSPRFTRKKKLLYGAAFFHNSSINFFHGAVMIHDLWYILGAGFQPFFSMIKPLLQTYEKS